MGCEERKEVDILRLKKVLNLFLEGGLQRLAVGNFDTRPAKIRSGMLKIRVALCRKGDKVR